MRNRLAQFVAVCILASQAPIHAQELSSLPDVEKTRSCPALDPSAGEQPSPPQIEVVEITFSGSPELAGSEQERVASSIKAKISEIAEAVPQRISSEGITDSVAELARQAWQNRGYFRAEVSGDSMTLTSNPVAKRIAVDLKVDAGAQYMLGEITLKHNKALDDLALRKLFPIQGGDIFSREKIANGLENLRNAYFDLGYINVAYIPLPAVDDARRVVSFDVEIDEGKQFRISSVNFLGIDESLKQELLAAFPVGQVYREHAFKQFLRDHPFGFQADDPWYVERHLDERKGAVAITLDARPCTPG